MSVLTMTKEDFQQVLHLGYPDFEKKCPIVFKRLVIIPADGMHESGYRNMEFCLIDDYDQPICRISGVTDVIFLDGIGGYGEEQFSERKISRMNEIRDWSMDCLPCGYLQLWLHTYELCIRHSPLSTLEVYARKERRIDDAEPERNGTGADVAEK